MTSFNFLGLIIFLISVGGIITSIIITGQANKKWQYSQNREEERSVYKMDYCSAMIKLVSFLFVVIGLTMWLAPSKTITREYEIVDIGFSADGEEYTTCILDDDGNALEKTVSAPVIKTAQSPKLEETYVATFWWFNHEWIDESTHKTILYLPSSILNHSPAA